MGAAARRAGLSPSFCDAPISRRPVCFLMHTFPPLDQRSSEGFSQVPADGFFSERIRGHRGLSFLRSFFSRPWASIPPPRQKTFLFLGVAGGTIERSCYSPHYVNTERDYERDYQATLPQGRTAADGCKPRHGRDDRKRERSFSGLRMGRFRSLFFVSPAEVTVWI